MRVGSVVAKVPIEATPRPYANHQAYCLFFADGTCGKCIDRCPVRAITEAGQKNKALTAAAAAIRAAKANILEANAKEHVRARFEGVELRVER